MTSVSGPGNCYLKWWFLLSDLYEKIRSGSRGRVQGVRTPPPRDYLRFSNTTGILHKKAMWFIGGEVEQETSAPPPEKKSWIRFWKSLPVRCSDSTRVWILSQLVESLDFFWVLLPVSSCLLAAAIFFFKYCIYTPVCRYETHEDYSSISYLVSGITPWIDASILHRFHSCTSN